MRHVSDRNIQSGGIVKKANCQVPSQTQGQHLQEGAWVSPFCKGTSQV